MTGEVLKDELIKEDTSLNDYLGNKQEKYFYYKNKSKEIVPVVDNDKNIKARKKLEKIYETQKYKLPKHFINNWEKVKLFEPRGDVERAHALIINPKEGSFDLYNKLNHLTGKEWIRSSCSWFIFNALHKDLQEERQFSTELDHHPATYSPTMMENFIKFFTKESMSVLDPFAGIGSTLVGCKRTGRVGYGVELNPKYHNLIIKRLPEFKDNVICGDSRNIKDFFKDKVFDFCISSPPYWDVLNRSTGTFEKDRNNRGLDVKYSNTEEDLGNISDYNKFLEDVTKIYLDIYDLLRNGAYIVVIVKNLKKGGKFYPLAWDIARILSEKYALKDEKIWIQDKVALAPYGYPCSWTANILHHYCLILRKERLK